MKAPNTHPQQTAPLTPARTRQLLARVAAIYSQAYGESEAARAALSRYGIADAALLDRHLVGYCDGRLRQILPTDDAVWQELETLGVLVLDGQAPGTPAGESVERFAGRVVFPVLDADGEVQNLYALADQPEAQETLCLPGLPPLPWNIQAARLHVDLLAVSAIIDGLALEIGGFHNVIAVPCGLDSVVMKEIGGHGVRRVVAIDGSGGALTRIVQELAGTQRSTRCSWQAIALPDRVTPVTYLGRHGAERLAAAVAGALPTAAAELPEPTPKPKSRRRRAGEGKPAQDGDICHDGDAGLTLRFGPRLYRIFGIHKAEGLLKTTVRAEHAGRLHVDTLNLYRANPRRTLCQDLARLFDQAPEIVEADLVRIILACEERDADGPAQAQRPDPAAAISAEERREAEAFGRGADLFAQIAADYDQCGLVGERDNKLLCYLAAVSRKLDHPLSVLVLSSSGAGKSALQNVTLSLCPPEDVVKLTSLTGRALFYQDELSLKHKVLAVEESVGAQQASYPIRSLISEGELVVSTTVRDCTSGRLTTTENRVAGPTAVFCTTTDPEVDPETRSRFFVIAIDESCAQTAQILACQRQRETPAGIQAEARVEGVRRRHRNFQRLLVPLKVVNRFARQLTYGPHRLQARRDQMKYLSLIRAVTFLRQMSKKVRTRKTVDGQVRYIETDLDDIAVANELALSVLGRSLDELSGPARDLLGLLRDLVRQATGWDGKGAGPDLDAEPRVSFTRREVREFTGWSRTRVHVHLRELLDMEYVVLDSGRPHCQQRYRLVYNGEGERDERFILGLKSVAELRRELVPAGAVADALSEPNGSQSGAGPGVVSG